MQSNNSEAVPRAGSGSRSDVLGELDLYTDLRDFLDLSPEERRGHTHRSDPPQPPEVAEATPAEATPATKPETEFEFTTERAFEAPTSFANEEKPFCEASAALGIGQEWETVDTLALDDRAVFSGSEAEVPKVLSRGVCLACGAQSEADDLFCVTCGGFLDEAASALPFNPNCADCGLGVIADEIFCPWCGSALSAA
jgi:hypothetical protein